MPRGQPGTLTHGAWTYYRGRCKCDICSTAAREYARKKYGYRPLSEYLAAIKSKHGTESRYTNGRCRCDECRAASAAAQRARRAKVKARQDVR